MEPLEAVQSVDCLIITVENKAFADIKLDKPLAKDGLIVDVKGFYDAETVRKMGYRHYWRL